MPCKVIAPYIEKLSEEHKDVIFVKVDVDEVHEEAAAADVTAMPTFHAVKNGQLVDKVIGADQAKILQLVTKSK